MHSPHYSDTCQCRNCRAVRAERQVFVCEPCECGGHPDCPVCGVGATALSRETELKLRAAEEFDLPEAATDEQIERSFDAYR